MVKSVRGVYKKKKNRKKEIFFLFNLTTSFARQLKILSERMKHFSNRRRNNYFFGPKMEKLDTKLKRWRFGNRAILMLLKRSSFKLAAARRFPSFCLIKRKFSVPRLCCVAMMKTSTSTLMTQSLNPEKPSKLKTGLISARNNEHQTVITTTITTVIR